MQLFLRRQALYDEFDPQTRIEPKQKRRNDMTRIMKAALTAIAAVLLIVGVSGTAEAFWGHRRVTTAYALPSVPVTVGYAPVAVAAPVITASPIVTASYAPVVTSPVVTASYAPVTTYYAPPTTTYYAPATTTYYAPAPVVSTPVTSYYAPTTSYYAPATTIAAPVTTYYAPAAAVIPTTTVIARRPVLFVP
jgi:hypothetical protein